MNVLRLLEAYDTYAARVRESDTREERVFWERHLHQIELGLSENGRKVRGEVGPHA